MEDPRISARPREGASLVGEEHVLTLVCPDRVGILSEVAGRLAAGGFNILTSQQHTDEARGVFYLRTSFRGAGDPHPVRDALAALTQSTQGRWSLDSVARKPGVLVMVSGTSHCLRELLAAQEEGRLPGVIRAVVGSDDTQRTRTEAAGIPFYHHDVQGENKPAGEQATLELVRELQVELVVLARYMRILSAEMCDALPPTINIHHSMLPAFKGARPYHQAYDRGVKLIGASAHYVIPALDEGPLIIQSATHVDHSFTPERLQEAGAELEAHALRRAVTAHLEDRVLLDGGRTVVFPPA